MYCIKCGVELADSEKRCPLCFTRVYHPDLEMPDGDPLFPDNPVIKRHTVTRAGSLFILTSLFLIALVMPLICNLSITGEVTWGGISASAIVLAYIIVVLPFWFKRPNPVVFVPVDHAAAALLLLHIDLFTDGNWFLSFALPTVGASCIISTAVIALCRYVRKGYLYIFGGATILSGMAIVLTEFLLNFTFDIHSRLVWSIYPCAAFLLIGLMLIIIAINPALRTTLEKKFFV